MKTRILLTVFVLCSICAKVNAQYVSIPDTNFGKWLFANGYSACMTGTSPHYNLDTTCNAVLSATLMEVSSQNIHNLDGVQYFKALTILTCKTNPLGSLGALPNTIQHLDCSYDSLFNLLTFPTSGVTISCSDNYLTSLPALPANISTFNCSVNQLTVLPSIPSTMQLLEVGENQLTSLPALPNGLSTLGYGYNNIPVMPSPLPTSITSLDVSGNNMHVIPSLPSTLVSFACKDDSLTTLPTLPPNLQFLWCLQNQLTSLPTLPNSLQFINCSTNQLTNIPNIGPNLHELYCTDNLITTLPNIPDSMDYFDCHNNPHMTCLPELKIVNHLNFSNTAVTCLPSYGSVVSSTPALAGFPLCDMYNPNGCRMAWNLSGNVYQDVDSDCYYSRYPDARVRQMKVMLYENGALLQQFFTGDGFYSFNVNNTWGTYVTQLDTTNSAFSIRCPAGGNYSSTISAIDSFLLGEDFSLTCKQGFDVGAFDVVNDPTLFARPATLVPILVQAGDLANQFNGSCAAGVSGQVQIVYSGAATYQGPASGALTPTVSGDTLTYAVADFSQLINSTAFNFILQIDSNAQAGSQVCFDINVTPTVDNNPLDNHLYSCFTVVNAIDPNVKEVSPAGNVDTTQEWLTYTVRFQNTGTAPALNIYLLDTLSTNVDESSVELLSYSHKNFTQVLDHGIIRFNFPNINLPDSNTNEPASHGYVRYKVKLKHGLPYGTQIKNTANIYFDLNPAVVTNTTTTTLEKVTNPGISNTKANDVLAVSIYPNPTNNVLNIVLDGKATYTIRIMDISGAEVMTQTTGNTVTTLNLSNLSKGMYFVEVTGNGMQARKKVVKM